MSRRTVRRLTLGSLGLLGLVFFITEYVYYFPLTPLSLDRTGATRLPRAANRVRLLFVGDVLLGDAGRDTLISKGYDHPFGATRQLIRSADLAIGNLEGPIAVQGRRNRRKRWSYKMPPRAARALKRAGFDLLDLANNHILDCGPTGLGETIRYLKEAGLVPFGAGRTAGRAHRPVFRTVRGVRFAFLGYFPASLAFRYNEVGAGQLRRGLGHRGTARGALVLIQRDIQRARQQADLVIVSLHMGDRYQRTPTPAQRKHCRRIIDAGADAVVAHGTHILGPVERYQGRPILYSLGNFAFGSGNVRARFSLMAFLEVDPGKRRLTGVQLLPIYTVNRNPWVRFQTKVLVGRQARKVILRLQRLSRPLGGTVQLRNRPTRGFLPL